MFMKKKLLSTAIISAILGGTLLLSACGSDDTTSNNTTATTTTAPADTSEVLATSDAGNVTENDVEDLKKMLPQQYATAPMDKLKPMLVEQVLMGKLLEKEALKYNTADSEEYKKKIAAIDKQLESMTKQLDLAKKEALHQTTYMKMFQELITDQMVTDEYTKNYSKAKEEVKARHILVKTEKEAKDLITKLKNGGDFAKLAAQFSTGPSGKTGGDLGWFTKEKMVPAFSNVAFKLNDHEFGIAKSSFGWHVIETEEHRTTPAPTLDDALKTTIKTKLAAGMAQTKGQSVLDKLMKDNHVKNIYMEGLKQKLKTAKDANSTDDSAKDTTTDSSTSTDDSATDTTTDSSTSTDDSATDTTTDSSTSTDDSATDTTTDSSTSTDDSAKDSTTTDSNS